MALQFSTAVRNAQLDVIESTTGISALLAICSGAIPANCAAAETGTRLATAALPSDWMAAASAGAKAKLGTWEDTSADATGLGGYFRIYDTTGTTCHIQGLVGQNWQASTGYVLNQQVINDSGKCYKCTVAGQSAGSGGPTGTGTGIVDNAAHWDYIGTADITIQNTSFATGQDFQVTALTWTAGNA